MSLTGNFDKLNKGNGGQGTVPPELSMDEMANYASPSQVRNLCFVQPDGNRLFLNYAYLVSGEYSPEENIIVLTYTTHIVILKGCNLSGLFSNLMSHICKLIVCEDKRYFEIEAREGAFVIDIEIVKQ
ncbi:hypothetical protein [Flavobacterium sp. TBRC 19031]|uniref:hypothetical protein n=1 Tax=Flavobacterium mekongense TaxID=3379707 RepID=UPI00399A67BF